jgi:hypothetical protein
MSYPPRNLRPASRVSARGTPTRLRSLAGSRRRSDVQLLGPTLRFARAAHAVATIERIALAVVALLVASVAVGDAPGAPVVTASGVGILLALVAVGAVLRDERHRLALDLIVEGEEWLPVRALVRERDRLGAVRRRARLARSYERLFEEGLSLRRPVPGPLPMVRPGMAARVLAELGPVAALLRSGDPGLRGVALAERLLIDGASPLYGEDVAALRAELGRARSLLCS